MYERRYQPTAQSNPGDISARGLSADHTRHAGATHCGQCETHAWSSIPRAGDPQPAEGRWDVGRQASAGARARGKAQVSSKRVSKTSVRACSTHLHMSNLYPFEISAPESDSVVQAVAVRLATQRPIGSVVGMPKLHTSTPNPSECLACRGKKDITGLTRLRGRLGVQAARSRTFSGCMQAILCSNQDASLARNHSRAVRSSVLYVHDSDVGISIATCIRQHNFTVAVCNSTLLVDAQETRHAEDADLKTSFQSHQMEAPLDTCKGRQKQLYPCPRKERCMTGVESVQQAVTCAHVIVRCKLRQILLAVLFIAPQVG
eukprot:365942-Chlamydomonas_euryale.AAC.71